MKNIILSLSFFILSLSFINTQPLSWTKVDGPNGGIVNCMAENKKGEYFAGAIGIYKSSNNGNNWYEIQTGFMDSLINNIVIDDTSGIYAYSEYNIYYSNDNGTKWNKTNYNAGFQIRGFAIDTNGVAYTATAGGLFSSNNKGSTWNKVGGSIADSSLYGITITPGNNCFVLTDFCVLKSEDNGLNWTFTLGLQSMSYFNDNITFGCNQSGKIYLLKSGNIATSFDEGLSWNYVNISEPYLDKVVNISIDSNNWVYIITVDDLWEEIIIYSKDNGVTFREIYNSPTCKYFFWDSNNSMYVFGKSKGIFMSQDNGTTWSDRNNGLNAQSIYVILTNYEEDIFILDYGLNIISSLNSNKTWFYPLKHKFHDTPYTLAIDISGNLYSIFSNFIDWGIYKEYLEKSDDKGESWSSLIPFAGGIDGNNLLFDKNNKLYYHKSYYNADVLYKETETIFSVSNNIIMTAISSTEILYALVAKDGIYMSTDKGKNWSFIKSLDDTNSKVLGITTGKPGFVFTWENGKVYQSSDDGKNWRLVQDFGNKNYLLNVIDLKADLRGNVFAIVKELGVYYSKDNGDKWQEINSGLDTRRLNKLNISSGGKVYLGTLGRGIYLLDLKVHVPENYFLLNLTCYPNPASGNLYIYLNNTTPGNITIKLFDLFGREVGIVYDGFAGENFQVNYEFGNISSGTYFVVLSSGSVRQACRVEVVN